MADPLYVLLVEYLRPMTDVEAHLVAHRAHLATYYDAGNLLVSGRLNPLTGGVVLAVGAREDIDRMVAEDPFVIEGIAAYEVLELHPTRVADDMRVLLAGRDVDI